jgi:predicted O-methyltransferase YrrM
MRALIAEDAGPFDLIFIDADKEGTPEYFQHALELSRPGTVIITDNVVRGGAIADPATEDSRALGMRRFHELLAAQPRVSATTIQTVGSKGYDGFTLALVER